MRVLITGFDPFGGASINPAYEAVKLLPDIIGSAEAVSYTHLSHKQNKAHSKSDNNQNRLRYCRKYL